MSVRLTREEFLEKIFSENYEELKSKDQLRLVRIRIPGKEVSLAHVIGVSQTEVYRTLGLHIGVHFGEDHTGDSIGLMKFTPWESVVIAADVAVKAARVEVGFMDRFSGALILTGDREEVKTAVKAVHDYFRDELGYGACELTER